MCLSYIPVTLWALSYQFHGWSVYPTRSKGMSQISVESRRRDMMVIGCESSQDSKSFPMRDPRIKGKWLNFYKAVDLFNLYNDLFFFLKVDGCFVDQWVRILSENELWSYVEIVIVRVAATGIKPIQRRSFFFFSVLIYDIAFYSEDFSLLLTWSV